MTTRLPIEEIVDRCIGDIRAGRMTVEECLLRYPHDRVALEPVLRAAAVMSTLPRGEQTAMPDPHARAAFMVALRETPQQRRRRFRVPLVAMFGPGAFRVVGPAFALAALAVALVLGGGATPAAASTLTIFDGEVQRLDGVEWRSMNDGAGVEAGVRVRTSSAGHALITFPDGSTVALDPQTELTIETLAMSPRRIEVRQQSGRLWHDIVHDETDGSRFVVLTPDVRIEVLGTVFETSVDAVTGQTDVATVDGEVRVVAGEQAVPVGRGETLRAHKSTLEEVAAGPLLDGAVTVSGPFAAAVMSSDGRGTGVRVDGVVFRQLRGITTTSGDGVQRFDLRAVEAGDYVLIVQRYGDGAGEIVLDTPGGQQRFAVEADTSVARLPLRLDLKAGLPSLVGVTLQTGENTPAAAARVAASERTKAAVELATQAQERSAARAETKAPTKTPTPKATERARTATVTPTRTLTPTLTLTPTRTAVATPVLDGAVAAYTRQLRAAIASGRSDEVRAVLTEAMSGENAALRRARVNVIAVALENETNAQRIASLFVNGQNSGLRDALSAALSADGGSGRARLDAAIVIADARRLSQLIKPRIPTATATATATPSPTGIVLPIQTTTPTATPTASPTVAPTAAPTASPTSTATPTVSPTATPTVTAPTTRPTIIPPLLPVQ